MNFESGVSLREMPRGLREIYSTLDIAFPELSKKMLKTALAQHTQC